MDAKLGFTGKTATFVFSMVERTISDTVCVKFFLDIINNPTKIKFKTISDVQVY